MPVPRMKRVIKISDFKRFFMYLARQMNIHINKNISWYTKINCISI